VVSDEVTVVDVVLVVTCAGVAPKGRIATTMVPVETGFEFAIVKVVLKVCVDPVAAQTPPLA
jgi:hypothetical protein